MEKDEIKEMMENMELEKQAEKQAEIEARAGIDDLFKQFTDGGYTAHLRRITPLYAAGYVGDIVLDGSINLQEIQESHGGKKYHVRITDQHGKYVARRSLEIADIPRRNGVPWLQTGISDDNAKVIKEKQPTIENPGFSQLAESIQMLIERQADIIERLSGDLLRQAQEKAGAVGQINELASAIEAIRGISENLQPPAPVINGSPDMQYLDIIKTYLQMKNDNPPPPPPSPRRFMTPLPIARQQNEIALSTRPPIFTPPPPPPPSTPLPLPVVETILEQQKTDSDPQNEKSIDQQEPNKDKLARLIADTDPDTLAEVFADQFKNMPQSKQMIIISKLSDL